MCAERGSAGSAAVGQLGVTAAPFIRSGPAAALDLAGGARELGYGSFLVAEVAITEALSVLGAVSQRAPGIGLGTWVQPVQVRTPATSGWASYGQKQSGRCL